MPYFHLAVASPLDPATQAFVARGTTTLIAEILRKRADVTAVRIDSVTPDAWFVNGSPVPQASVARQAVLWITEGTNTAEEKADFISQLDRLLKETFGPGPEASYIVIHEIAATDWGYDGQTQAGRRNHGLRNTS